MVSFTYPNKLVRDIESAKSMPKKLFSATYILMRLGAMLFIALFFILGLFFIYFGFATGEMVISWLFGIFFIVFGLVGIYIFNRRGPIDNVKQVELTTKGLILTCDFGIKWAIPHIDIEDMVLVDGNRQADENIASIHGLMPMFATYIVTIGKYGQKAVIQTPVFYIPKSDLSAVRGILASWKKTLIPLQEFSEDAILERDNKRFANALFELGSWRKKKAKTGKKA